MAVFMLGIGGDFPSPESEPLSFGGSIQPVLSDIEAVTPH